MGGGGVSGQAGGPGRVDPGVHVITTTLAGFSASAPLGEHVGVCGHVHLFHCLRHTQVCVHTWGVSRVCKVCVCTPESVVCAHLGCPCCLLMPPVPGLVGSLCRALAPSQFAEHRAGGRPSGRPVFVAPPSQGGPRASPAGSILRGAQKCLEAKHVLSDHRKEDASDHPAWPADSPMKDQDSKLGGAAGAPQCMWHRTELHFSYSSPGNCHLRAHFPRLSCHSTPGCMPDAAPSNEAPRLAMYIYSCHPFRLSEIEGAGLRPCALLL